MVHLGQPKPGRAGLGQPKPGRAGLDHQLRKKMAEASTSSVQVPIVFDLFSETDDPDFNFLSEEMSKDEKQEITTVISLLDSVNSKELMDFSTQQTESRHRSINESELDRLAAKNNALTTNYQTKWAVAVFKGNIQCIHT